MARPADPAPDDATPLDASPAGTRPDWLVGADEGVESERERSRHAADAARSGEPLELERPIPRLVRPDAGWNTLPTQLRDRSQRPEKPAEPEKPKAWTGAGSSVPRLSHDATRVPRADRVELVEDEDAEEGEFGGVPGADEDRATTVLRPTVKPPDEPFYVVALDALATNRVLQLGLTVGLALVVATWAFWPRERGASVAEIKRQPVAFEGRPIRIDGRVGEVFTMGRGYVFNLHQGRDTVVVFTSVRVPKTKQKIEVRGTVSTGYLDGAPRVALFETSR